MNSPATDKPATTRNQPHSPPGTKVITKPKMVSSTGSQNANTRNLRAMLMHGTEMPAAVACCSRGYFVFGTLSASFFLSLENSAITPCQTIRALCIKPQPLDPPAKGLG